MTSTDALILDLSANLAPVKRRSVLRESIALLTLGVVELALILMMGGMRPDMRWMIFSPDMLWKIGSLALLAGFCCTVALRSFAPPASSRRGPMLALGIAGLAATGGLFVASAADSARPLLSRLSPVHGLFCVLSIVVLALPMMAALAVLMRRAAPANPAQSALAAGVAASTCGALIFTACCPMNDPLYIVVWYSVAVAAVTVVARLLLPQRFRL